MKCIIGRKIKNLNNNSLERNLLGVTFKNIRTIHGINQDVTERMIELVFHIFLIFSKMLLDINIMH